jgi:hydroxymethylglutaryl-CoA lyase
MMKRVLNQATRPFRLFDVSLRDGLQASPDVVPTAQKLSMLDTIAKIYRPQSIEVGSLVSKDVLPQLADSEKVFEHALDMITGPNAYSFTPYLLVAPTAVRFKRAVSIGCDSVSVPASVSDAFQRKNVRRSLDETYDIIVDAASNLPFNNFKVYLSCVDYCPVSGNIATPQDISKEVTRYAFQRGITQISLSDTAGTLTDETLMEIMTLLKEEMVNPSMIGLHIHLSDSMIDIHRVAKILGVAELAGIGTVDVSYIDQGGCSVTMESDTLKKNTTYNSLNECSKILEHHYPVLMMQRSSLKFCRNV